MNILKSMHRSALVPAAVLATLGLLGATQALAAPPASVKVDFRDLDLSTSAGAQTLYRRITSAARDVCGYEGRALTDVAAWKGCYRGAIADAVAKVNNPLLTALHTGRPSNTTTAMLSR